MTPDEEVQAAKDYLWSLFVTQMAVGWKPWPRDSMVVYYLKGGKNGNPEQSKRVLERMDWLEGVGKGEARRLQTEMAEG